MNKENELAPLFTEAANIYAQHDSLIAETACKVLVKATKQQIVKKPNTVAQCSALNTAYSQCNNPLVSLLEQHEQQIHWADSGAAKKPKDVQEKLAFAELVGPTGMVHSEHCRIGLFFQSQCTDYPNHKHAAEELYLIISGVALWSQESAHIACAKQPGEFMHHASWEPHRMQTTTEPLLAMWCWTGDINYDQYKLV